ncbi:hypothetical protein JCM10213_007334 [Rhodosporidiobolus nylandii]
MGLEYFSQTCGTEATTQAATIWCVVKEGTCCAVCPNTLASVGTRIGLTFTVFFATAVVVVDGAEAPFIFLTTCLQALAYISTILYQGLRGAGISRFHAYYALFSSLGFLCPLAAASVTAPHFHYGGSHPKKGVRLLAFRTNIRHDADPHSQSLSLARRHRDYLTDRSPALHGGLASFSMRSLGASPFFSSTCRGAGRGVRRPLTSTDPFKHHEGTSTENSPVLRPREEGHEDPPERMSSSARSVRASRLSRQRIPPDDEEAAFPSPQLRATPSTLLGLQPQRSPHLDSLYQPDAPPSPHSFHSPHSPQSPQSHHHIDTFSSPPSPRSPLPPHSPHTLRRDSAHHNSVTALPSIPLPPPALPHAPVLQPSVPRRRKRLQKVRNADERKEREKPSSPPRRASQASTVYEPAQRLRIERKTQGGAWRRYGMLTANVTLSLLWLFTLLCVHEVVGSFKLIQTTCEDPAGTALLSIATEVFLALGAVVLFVFLLNFYSHWLHRQLRRILDYNRDPGLVVRLALPGILSGTVFTLWATLLWSSYSLAAQPNSSLLASTEESATFPTTLSIALCVKPVCDLIKAFFKIYKRRAREAKDQAKEAAKQATPALPAKPAPSRAHGPTLDVLEGRRKEIHSPLLLPAIKVNRAEGHNSGRSQDDSDSSSDFSRGTDDLSSSGSSPEGFDRGRRRRMAMEVVRSWAGGSRTRTPMEENEHAVLSRSPRH